MRDGNRQALALILTALTSLRVPAPPPKSNFS